MPFDYLDPEVNPEQFVVINGMVVERDVLGIVAEINSRWPNLRVQYLDPESAPGLLETPYQIVETDAQGIDRVVLGVWELNGSVLSHLASMDSHAGCDLDAIISKTNAAARKAQQDQWQGLKDSAVDVFAGVVGTTKDTYSFTDPVTGRKVTTKTTEPHRVEGGDKA